MGTASLGGVVDLVRHFATMARDPAPQEERPHTVPADGLIRLPAGAEALEASPRGFGLAPES
jgi:cystathionine beta-lyase/cystathionine gamma-synthase